MGAGGAGGGGGGGAGGAGGGGGGAGVRAYRSTRNYQKVLAAMRYPVDPLLPGSQTQALKALIGGGMDVTRCEDNSTEHEQPMDADDLLFEAKWALEHGYTNMFRREQIRARVQACREWLDQVEEALR